MRINGDIKKNSLIAGLAGIFFTLVVLSAVFLGPAVLDFINDPFTPGSEPGPDIVETKLGARIAKYMESRSSDVLFSWCYNNTFSNVNLTDFFQDYVDGFLIYGAPVNESIMGTNISVLHISGVETAEFDSSDLNTVATSFENALKGLDNVSTTITEWMDFWPPTFLWDVAYKDNTSISLAYSQEHRVIGIVNGTWTMSKFGLEGEIVVDFPQFEYNWESFDNRAYLILDDESEALVLTAIQVLYDKITGAFNE
ncbi:MAG: hypothetical protein ACFFD4_03625 [Candidatus Odinarchaeota archaeon]